MAFPIRNGMTSVPAAFLGRRLRGSTGANLPPMPQLSAAVLTTLPPLAHFRRVVESAALMERTKCSHEPPIVDDASGMKFHSISETDQLRN